MIQIFPAKRVVANCEVSDRLTHFAFTRDSSSVNFTNLPLIYLARDRRFDNLEHFSDTEQIIEVTYTAAIEQSCYQRMFEYIAARARHQLLHTTKQYLLKKKEKNASINRAV